MSAVKIVTLIAFGIWSFPLGYYRLRFRKIVYKDPSWTIAVKPYFIKETKALFGSMYPTDKEYLKNRNFYRYYLLIYFLLFGLYQCL